MSPRLSAEVRVITSDIVVLSLPDPSSNITVVAAEVSILNEEGYINRILERSLSHHSSHLLLRDYVPLCISTLSVGQCSRENSCRTIVAKEASATITCACNGIDTLSNRSEGQRHRCAIINEVVRTEVELLATIVLTALKSVSTIIKLSKQHVLRMINERRTSTPAVTTIEELTCGNILQDVLTSLNRTSNEDLLLISSDSLFKLLDESIDRLGS